MNQDIKFIGHSRTLGSAKYPSAKLRTGSLLKSEVSSHKRVGMHCFMSIQLLLNIDY